MRITTLGPAGRLRAAILPVPARDARAYQDRGTIYGSPGTVPVPAPWPAGVSQDWTHHALHRSSDAPPEWRPSIYYQRGPNGTHPSVSVESDNQMPVPAKDATGRPAVMARRPQFLRQRQVGAVNTVTTYDWWR
jgi:hypothetical protein